jgi:hypothetical protein
MEAAADATVRPRPRSSLRSRPDGVIVAPDRANDLFTTANRASRELSQFLLALV